MQKGEAVTTVYPSFQLPPCQQTRSVPTAVMGPSAPFYSILPPHLFAGLYNFVSPVSVVACHPSDICFLCHLWVIVCLVDHLFNILLRYTDRCGSILECLIAMTTSSLHSTLVIIGTVAGIYFWY